VIAALGSVAVIKSDSIFEPSIPIEWIKLVAFLIALFAAVCAWGHSLLALKIGDCPVLQKNDDTAKHLDMADIVSREQYIINAYVHTTEKISEVAKEKSKYIELAYEELTMCAWFLGIVAAIAIGMEILK